MSQLRPSGSDHADTAAELAADNGEPASVKGKDYSSNHLTQLDASPHKQEL